MIRAAIDIGSNTCLLLIAKVDASGKVVEVLCEEQRVPRLGKGVDKDGNLSSHSIDKLFAALEDYRVKIGSIDETIPVIVTATSAVRDAKNGSEIVARIKSQFSWEVFILPGEVEAEVTFSGALSRLDNQNSESRVLVIDIGGGSTELIFGSKNEGILNRISMNAGCVRYTERFSELTKNDARKTIADEIKKLNPSEIKNQSVESLIGVAGTLTSLAAMKLDLREWQPEKVNGYSFTLSQAKDWILELAEESPDELLHRYPTIMTGRHDVFHAGLFILLAVLEVFQPKNLTISTGGMREGALLKMDYIRQVIEN